MKHAIIPLNKKIEIVPYDELRLFMILSHLHFEETGHLTELKKMTDQEKNLVYSQTGMKIICKSQGCTDDFGMKGDQR